jgi:hypothetical protein
VGSSLTNMFSFIPCSPHIARGAYFKTVSQGMGIKHSFFLDIGHGYLDTKGDAMLLKGPDHSCIASAWSFMYCFGLIINVLLVGSYNQTIQSQVNIVIIILLCQFVTISRYKITVGDTEKPCFVL